MQLYTTNWFMVSFPLPTRTSDVFLLLIHLFLLLLLQQSRFFLDRIVVRRGDAGVDKGKKRREKGKRLKTPVHV